MELVAESVRHDDGPSPGILENPLVFTGFQQAVDGYGRHPVSHDGQIGDAPFGLVVRQQRNPVAALQTE